MFRKPWYWPLLPDGSHYQRGNFINRYITRCVEIDGKDKKDRYWICLKGFKAEETFEMIQKVCEELSLNSIDVHILDKRIKFNFIPG